MSRYPRIRVNGSPYERGVQYGQLASDRVYRSRCGYEKTFLAATGLSWDEACEVAAVMEGPIEAAFPQYIDEMRGIADGAGLPFSDILTMNCRTEILWSERARTAAEQRLQFAQECTAFGLLPERTVNGHTLLGQNWDWLVQGTETIVILEVEQESAPNFVTAVEAGLLAKAGMNSAGLAVLALALVSSKDSCSPGIPFHVMLRALMDCPTMMDAVELMHSHVRASSANYLVGHKDNVILNFETAPGDFSMVSVQHPVQGSIVHANHFLDVPKGAHDVFGLAMPDSPIRLQRIRGGIGGQNVLHSRSSLRSILSDHADFPNSLCCHPDHREHPDQQWCTAVSLMFDLTSGEVFVAEGNPCDTEYEKVELGALLDKANSIVPTAAMPVDDQIRA